MSQFFERNKKKGLLSVLLLFFQRGKGGGPLLLMVTLLAFVFIIPASTLINSPFTQRLSRMLGLRSGLGGGQMLVEKSDGLAMDDARRGVADPGALFNGPGAEARYGKSTVDLVKGGGVEEAKSDAVDKLAGEGKDVDGVLRPEDAQDLKDGVPLSEEDLVGGLLKNVEAAGAGMNDGGFSLGGGARAVSRSDDLLAKSLDDADVPGMQARSKGAARGKLGWSEFKKINSRVSSAVGGSRRTDRKTAMLQLAEGRAYSVAAAPPPGKCDPNGCPGEYASNTSGVMFDGGRTKGSLLLGPEESATDLPTDGEIGDMLEEGSQMEKDAKACEDANAKYGPQMDKKSAEMQDLSNQLNALDCGAGCGANAQKCKKVGDKMKEVCREEMKISQDWAAACPLTEGRSDTRNCDQ